MLGSGAGAMTGGLVVVFLADLVRSTASTADENETDPEKIR